jgi:hypothetical protein
MLKQTVVKIKVIAESVDQCIKSLIKMTEIVNIKPLVEGARDSINLPLKARCTEYLHLSLAIENERNSKGRPLLDDKTKDSVATTLKSNLSAADPKTREEARNCFLEFEVRWPEEARR